MRDGAWSVLPRALARLPQGAISRLTGRIADLRIPMRLRSPLLGTFARVAGIDPAEAERPIDEYASLNEFFVRRLRSGARTWPDDPAVIASPVDGLIGAMGRIELGTLVQAKGHVYPAAELLDDAEQAARFTGGEFLTLYLSPRHYHRVHAPANGTIAWAKHVPGRLLPVNPMAVVRFPRIFARNERVACVIESAASVIAVVAIGAINVGRISTAFDPEWTGPDSPALSTHRATRSRSRHYDPPKPVERGEEIMAFHLGSTVVLLTGPGAGPLRDDLGAGREARLGSPLTLSARRQGPLGA